MPFGHRLGLHHLLLFRWFLLLVLAAVLVAGVILLVRNWRYSRPGNRDLRGGGSSPAGGFGFDPALDELRLRYARGELSWEEYSERAANLGSCPAPGASHTGGPSQAPPGP